MHRVSGRETRAVLDFGDLFRGRGDALEVLAHQSVWVMTAPTGLLKRQRRTRMLVQPNQRSARPPAHPFVITEAEIRTLVDGLEAALAEAGAHVAARR
jgi:hypothetical protein